MNLNRLRLVLSLSGMVVAVAAIMLDDRRLVWGAIALLAASVIVRLVRRSGRPGGSDREM
jgi:hypothetical protein